MQIVNYVTESWCINAYFEGFFHAKGQSDAGSFRFFCAWYKTGKRRWKGMRMLAMEAILKSKMILNICWERTMCQRRWGTRDYLMNRTTLPKIFLRRTAKAMKNLSGFRTHGWRTMVTSFHATCKDIGATEGSADAQRQVTLRSKSPGFFLCFWTQRMWDRLVEETHRYATKQRAAHPPPPFSRWQAPSVEEMKMFVGLYLI